jgi:sec-independent protein translocase protein TatB
VGNFGVVELAVIGVIALLVFGPERLPEMARNAARLVGRFRAEAGRAMDELKRAGGLEGLDDEIRSIRDEVRGARDDVSRGLRQPMEELKSVARGGPTEQPAAEPAADAPPPVDTEAT